MKCIIQIFIKSIPLVASLIIIIKSYFEIKSNIKKKLRINKYIYEKNFKDYNYQNLFESKINNIDFKYNGYDIIVIINFIESLHNFKNKKNKFKGLFTKIHFKKLYSEANKIYSNTEHDKIFDLTFYNETERWHEFYQDKKDALDSFKKAFIKFYKYIYDSI